MGGGGEEVAEFVEQCWWFVDCHLLVDHHIPPINRYTMLNKQQEILTFPQIQIPSDRIQKLYKQSHHLLIEHTLCQPTIQKYNIIITLLDLFPNALNEHINLTIVFPYSITYILCMYFQCRYSGNIRI